MAQAREFDAKKEQRLAREKRHYTPDLLGRPCTVCKTPIPKVIAATHSTHPCCDPDPDVRAAIAADTAHRQRETTAAPTSG